MLELVGDAKAWLAPAVFEAEDTGQRLRASAYLAAIELLAGAVTPALNFETILSGDQVVIEHVSGEQLGRRKGTYRINAT